MNEGCDRPVAWWRPVSVAGGRARQTVAMPILAALLVLLVGAAGASAQGIGLKATAPALVSPIDRTRLHGVPDSVTLTAENAQGIFVQVAFDHRFDVYDVTRATTLVASSLVQAGGASAAYRFVGPLAEHAVYQWRVRAERDGVGGPWSESWTFETGAALPSGFTDVTTDAGLGGPASIRLGGHGSAFADATGDGRPDLYITNNFNNDPVVDQFFVNRGGGTFMEAGAARGIADFDAGSHGAAWGDLDNDGDFDLVNGTTGVGAPNDVFRNNGGGVFTDVTPASIHGRREETRGVALFDMDRDGDLDIFFVTGWRGGGDPPGERNELYRNDGGMQFTPIISGAAYTAPAGQGVTDTDFDRDGDVDLITGNRDGDLVILRNAGNGDFTLVDPGTIGVTHRSYAGATMGDIDTDGDLDMLLVGLDAAGRRVGHLYRNLGTGTFGHLRDFTDIDGYMGGFADLDHDSDLDLVFAGDDLVYLNDGRGAFSAGPPVPVAGISDPRAIAFADIDADGDLDFVVAAKRSRNWLIRNDIGGGNWLKIHLRSPSGAAGAFGAKVAIYDAVAAGRPPLAIRETRSANGYLGQDDPLLHVGLGDRTRVNVMVLFLNGTMRGLSNVTSNQTVTIDGSVGGSAPVFIEQHKGRR